MIVDVAVPVPLAASFHYEIDPEQANQLQLGSVVQVSFGRRTTHAFVLGFPESTDIASAKLKKVESVLTDEPLFDETMLRFLKWLSDYYCHPLGEVISAAIPKQYCFPSKKKRKSQPKKVESVLPGVAEKPVLNEEQQFAVSRILDPLCDRPVLLHGVTGSGKTEVYMAVLEEVLKQGKSAIVLVPEIALTPLLLGRFSARFPDQIAVLHSELTVKERQDEWNRVRKGEARVVIGARSAIFAPVQNLGLIVVDEEHETSFKQEDSLRYHARDAAVVRAKQSGARIVLGSATPSLESFYNAQAGRYLYVTLHHRVQNRPMPKTHFVDIKDRDNAYSADQPWLSKFLVAQVEKTMRAGQQALLYLNRLGFAHFLFCKDCGHTWRCRNCDVSLTFYRHPPQLKCHYCGLIDEAPTVCEECQGNNLDCMGLGTEQVETELKKIFPDKRILRMDRSVVKNRNELHDTLVKISNREADIIIGTQMVTKGHDFPGISLVGILLADSSLNLPDYRAHERTFQIITQVSGRAGRADSPGTVVIQTVNPEHPVLKAAAENRTADFYRSELSARQLFGFPPYARLAMLRFQHRNPRVVESFALEVAEVLKKEGQRLNCPAQLLGPSEAPIAKMKNYHRWQCLVKSDSVRGIQLLVKRAQDYVQFSKTQVRVFFDIDPVNAL